MAEIRESEEFLEILEKLSPGTPLREGIDQVVKSEKGGLIVLANEDEGKAVIESGFKLNSDFTSQKLAELSKMDRAVIVDRGLNKITYANAYLVPDPTIPSQETGTRHLAAEKTAKQLGVVTIAISASKGSVTIYFGDTKYVLPDLATLHSKVNQALRILEQYRESFSELSRELIYLEFEGRVLPANVADLIQIAVRMMDTEEEIKRWFIELGEDKELLEVQLEWLMLNVREFFQLVIKDFRKDSERPASAIASKLEALPTEDLVSTEKIMSELGYEIGEEVLDTRLPARGYMALREIPRIPMAVIERLVDEFGTLENIMSAEREELMDIKGIAEVRAKSIQSGLNRLQRGLSLMEVQ